MNLTFSWMQSEWMTALGWTFVHSLWQIALAGFLLFITLKLIPRRNAHTRYMVSTMALWMIVVMTLSTFLIMLPDSRHITSISGKVILMSATEPVTIANRISTWLEARMPMMLTIWLGGVAILLIRLALSLGWIRHIRATAIPEVEIQTALNLIIQRLRLKISPAASTSGLIHSPITIGHLKPMILFPIGIINQLTPAEVEAILTHELAHIVRRDYLANIVQSFIETLFYYHPVTWWISSMVREERENRADDLAISWCGDHLGYAKALLAVQEMQGMTSSPSLAVGFASRKGAMLERIQRILNVPYKNHNQMEKTVLLGLCSLCFLAFTFTSQNQKQEAREKITVETPKFPDSAERTDSIPAQGIYRIHKKTDSQDISIEVEDGEIRELKVDGKEIEPSEFDQYDEVIDELLGEVEAPPSMEEFEFMMPPMPEMPEIPMIPPMPPMEMYEFEMAPMPGMPEMPEIELEHYFNDNGFRYFGDGSGIAIWGDDGAEEFNIEIDSTPDGQTKIIIIRDGDSSVICTPHTGWSGEAPRIYLHHDGTVKEEDWKKYEEAWKEQAEQWKEQWRGHADEWRAHQEELRHQWRDHSEQQRAEEEMLRHQFRGNLYWNEDQQRTLERELGRADEELARVYEFHMPRLSLSDEMVRDGLLEPGEEAEVQLTPEKLKINGEKMPDHIHKKYLRIYEEQQGVELSGNSKVEFTTKSKQRM